VSDSGSLVEILFPLLFIKNECRHTHTGGGGSENEKGSIKEFGEFVLLCGSW
jgi:hypothetical protein